MTHLQLSCKSILNYCDTYRMPDTFTINPYRGCEFGCTYCYARYTHQFMELEWEEFEKKIFVKSQAAEVLLRSLDQGKLAGRHIAIGTATDPYQPAEARFRVTRELLKIFTMTRDVSLSVTTKSSLVQRDIDVLQEVAARNDFRVNISLISLDPELLSKLEPRSSRPQARLKALREITSAGVSAGVFLMPVLPGITDSRQNLESVVRAAHSHGARYISASVLFLRESAKRIFYSHLKRNHPALYRQYEKMYGSRVSAPRHYQKRVLTLIAELKEKYGYEKPAGRQKLPEDGPNSSTLLWS